MAPDSHAWSALLGLDAPSAPAYFAGTAQGLQLLLRLALVTTAALALASKNPAYDGRKFGLVAASIATSLIWSGAWLPASALSVATLASSSVWSVRTRIIGVAAFVLLVSAASFFPPAQVARSGDMAPPAATTRALERGNLYEARFWARRWAELEGDDPRDGTLIWARVEDQAGHTELARRIASTVATRSSREEVRTRAKALVDTLDATRGAPQ